MATTSNGRGPAETADVAEADPNIVRCEPAKPGKHRLAGMALRNGVLIIGPTHWAAAVRGDDGEIHATCRNKPSLGAAVERWPALRGPIRLGEMLAILPAVRTALPQARLALESPTFMGTTVASSLFGRGLHRRFGRSAATEMAAGAGALAMALAALRGGELSQYHGAEHKVIGGYELDVPPAEAPKEHPRCGTQLALPMLFSNAAAMEGMRLLLPGHRRTSRALGLGLGMAAATEFARSSQRNRDRVTSRLTQKLGTGLQAIASTREPTRAQLEVAERALAELLACEPAP